MKTLTLADIDWTVEALPEDIQIEGNCSAIDEPTDAATANWIRQELNSGNQWAWCCVRVSGRWNGLEAEDFLGGCSYESEAAFCAPGGYYDDMRAAVLAEIQSKAATIVEALAEEVA